MSQGHIYIYSRRYRQFRLWAQQTFSAQESTYQNLLKDKGSVKCLPEFSISYILHQGVYYVKIKVTDIMCISHQCFYNGHFYVKISYLFYIRGAAPQKQARHDIITSMNHPHSSHIPLWGDPTRFIHTREVNYHVESTWRRAFIRDSSSNLFPLLRLSASLSRYQHRTIFRSSSKFSCQ